MLQIFFPSSHNSRRFPKVFGSPLPSSPAIKTDTVVARTASDSAYPPQRQGETIEVSLMKGDSGLGVSIIGGKVGQSPPKKNSYVHYYVFRVPPASGVFTSNQLCVVERLTK